MTAQSIRSEPVSTQVLLSEKTNHRPWEIPQYSPFTRVFENRDPSYSKQKIHSENDTQNLSAVEIERERGRKDPCKVSMQTVGKEMPQSKEVEGEVLDT